MVSRTTFKKGCSTKVEVVRKCPMAVAKSNEAVGEPLVGEAGIHCKTNKGANGSGRGEPVVVGF